jgi:hypothetical protein
MLNRYLGQIGQDRTVVKFLLNHYGPTDNERFEDPGTIMSTGSIKVPMPFQKGIIERVIYEQNSWFSLINYSFRIWLFQDTITSAVRGSQKAFTSSEMDSVIGYIDARTGDDVGTQTDIWVYGERSVPYANMLQKTVNIPFVINSENPTLDVVEEYIGDGITLYDTYIYCYLIIKRD